MNLKTATILGFYSLPSLHLAEHNPTAYNNALRDAPKGAGSCAHCGRGILHNVIVRDQAGNTLCIGTDCAQKVGLDPEALRNRMTTEQLAERRARWEHERDQARQKYLQREAAIEARKALRRERYGDLLTILRGMQTEFHSSLAEQLESNHLSYNQACYVAKATSATGRRNKRNADAWDAVVELCCERHEETFTTQA